MSSPLADPFTPPAAPIGPTVADADFFAVFWRWEKYRLAYNGVLLAETLLGIAITGIRRPLNWISSLVFLAATAWSCSSPGPCSPPCWRESP